MKKNSLYLSSERVCHYLNPTLFDLSHALCFVFINQTHSKHTRWSVDPAQYMGRDTMSESTERKKLQKHLSQETHGLCRTCIC